MGRSSRGAHGAKLDWSKHERAWVDILHRDIFETGVFFRKTEINQFKKKPKNFCRKKNRESPEEDEGFEVKIILKVKCNFVKGRDEQPAICQDGSTFLQGIFGPTSPVRLVSEPCVS